MSIDVSIDVMHNMQDYSDEMGKILLGCYSGTLHQLIDEVPACNLVGSRTKMKQAVKYDNRYKERAPFIPSARIQYSREMSPQFEVVKNAIVEGIRPAELIGLLMENNELRRDKLNVVEARVIGN